MSSVDAIRQVQSALQSVLDDYDVQWGWTRRDKHLAVEFFVQGKKVLMTYAAGDPRAHLNAKSDLRRLLTRYGAAMKGEPPLSQTAHANGQAPVLPEHPVTVQSDPVDEVRTVTRGEKVYIPLPDPVPELVTTAQRLNDNDSYLVYETAVLAPAKCIVIELTKDLMVSAGGVLVIPLTLPNTVLDFTKDQFNAMFRAVPNAPKAAPLKVPAPPEPPAALVPTPPGKNPSVYAGIAPHSETLWWKPSFKTATTPAVTGGPPRPEDGRAYGMGPQMGRILMVCRHLSVDLNTRKFTTKDVEPFLSMTDYRQFSARAPKLEHLGYFAKEGPSGRSWIYKLTQKGIEVANTLGDWPWTRDRMQIPSWTKK